MSTPFSNVRIIDFTRFLAGPFGTHQFALQGADVVKIESFEGDDTRTTTIDKKLAAEKMSPGFMAVNPNKRSITLDLRKPEAIDLIKTLVKDADIVWENFRPGVMKKLGLDYAVLSQVNPKLIYCSVSGFGHSGPEQFTAAFDGKIQAMSGIMSLTGDPAGGPMRVGVAICDLIGGMTAAFAVATALYQRTHTGQGQFVDVAMLDAMLNFLSPQVAEYTVTNLKQRQFGNQSVSRKVTAHLFKAGSGDIMLAVLTEKQFERLLQTVGRADALTDPRFKDWFARAENEAALREILESGMASHTPAYWEAKLTEADVPCATVYAIDEIVHHAQLAHRTVLQQVESPAGRHTLVGSGFELAHDAGRINTPAPRLGQHTEEVLRQAGFSVDAIETLRFNGVIGERSKQAELAT
jgi:crotonobetainyl-CoA:carnitine CoA-transferase CaiB-like acyl-CoA transferase